MAYDGYPSAHTFDQPAYSNGNPYATPPPPPPPPPPAQPQPPQNPNPSPGYKSYAEWCDPEIDPNRVVPFHPQYPHQPAGPPPPPSVVRPIPTPGQPVNNSANQSQFYPPPPDLNGNEQQQQQQPQPQQPQPQPQPQSQPPPPAGTGFISPEIISQITATVIEQLRTSNLNGQQQQQPQQPGVNPNQNNNNVNNHGHFNPDMPQATPSVSTQSNRSPSNTNAQVYTPPSPYRPFEDRPYTPQQHTAGFTGGPLNNPDPEKVLHSPFARRPGVPTRISTTGDETTLEKIWGQLFDKDDKPTPRLGQFLRGIAMHVIENYPPGNTLVATPEKMQKFYRDTSVATDTHPWNDIFDDRTSSISRLYREVCAEHHYVQERIDKRPETPALTPKGFEQWATLMIQANPDREFARLHRAVREMPISNPDDKRERFPKELSRRLFPKFADDDTRDLLDAAITTHCYVTLPSPSNRERSEPGPRHQRVASTVEATRPRFSPQPGGGPEGKRRTYTGSPAVLDEEDEPSTSHPIERERKPYPAQPGGGRVYGEPGATRTSSPLHPHPHPHSKLRDINAQGTRARSSSMGVRGYASQKPPDNGGDPLYGAPPSASSIPQQPPFGTDFDDLRYRDDRDHHDDILYDGPRERGRQHDDPRYPDHRYTGSWGSEEDYYRANKPEGDGGGRPRPHSTYYQ